MSYIKNVAKSFVYTLPAIAKNLQPVAFNTYTSNAQVVKDISGTVKDVFRNNNISKNTKYIKDSTNKAVSNIKSDLRTGNLYNKDREKQAEMASISSFFGESGSEFDSLMSDNFDFDLDKDSVVETEKEVNNTVNKNNFTKNNNTLHKNTQINNNTFVQDPKGFEGLGKINATIGSKQVSALQGVFEAVNIGNQFNISHTAKFYEESIKHYNVTDNLLRQIAVSMENVNELLRESGKFAKRDDNDIRMDNDDIINSDGTMNLDAYFKHLKRNVSNSMGGVGMFKSFVKPMFETMIANPIGNIMNAMTTQFIPKAFRDASKTFDKILSNLPSMFLLKMNEMSKGDNFFKSKLGEIFGIKDTSMNFGRYNKKAVQFDGMTKRAITNVIPSLLGDILSAIKSMKSYDARRDIDSNKKIYDYDKGVFNTKSKLRSDIARDGQDNTFNSRSHSIASSVADSLGSTLSKEERKKIIEETSRQVSLAYENASKKGVRISGNMKGEDIGVSDDIAALISRDYSKANRLEQLEIQSSLIKSIQTRNRNNRNIERDIYSGKQVALDDISINPMASSSVSSLNDILSGKAFNIDNVNFKKYAYGDNEEFKEKASDYIKKGRFSKFTNPIINFGKTITDGRKDYYGEYDPFRYATKGMDKASNFILDKLLGKSPSKSTTTVNVGGTNIEIPNTIAKATSSTASSSPTNGSITVDTNGNISIDPTSVMGSVGSNKIFDIVSSLRTKMSSKVSSRLNESNLNSASDVNPENLGVIGNFRDTFNKVNVSLFGEKEARKKIPFKKWISDFRAKIKKHTDGESSDGIFSPDGPLMSVYTKASKFINDKKDGFFERMKKGTKSFLDKLDQWAFGKKNSKGFRTEVGFLINTKNRMIAHLEYTQLSLKEFLFGSKDKTKKGIMSGVERHIKSGINKILGVEDEDGKRRGGLVEKGKNVLSAITNPIKESFEPIVYEIKSTITKAVKTIVDTLTNAVKSIAKKLFDFSKLFATKIWDMLKGSKEDGVIRKAIDGAKSTKLGGRISRGIKSVKNPFKSFKGFSNRLRKKHEEEGVEYTKSKRGVFVDARADELNKIDLNKMNAKISAKTGLPIDITPDAEVINHSLDRNTGVIKSVLEQIRENLRNLRGGSGNGSNDDDDIDDDTTNPTNKGKGVKTIISEQKKKLSERIKTKYNNFMAKMSEQTANNTGQLVASNTGFFGKLKNMWMFIQPIFGLIKKFIISNPIVKAIKSLVQNEGFKSVSGKVLTGAKSMAGKAITAGKAGLTTIGGGSLATGAALAGTAAGSAMIAANDYKQAKARGESGLKLVGSTLIGNTGDTVGGIFKNAGKQALKFGLAGAAMGLAGGPFAPISVPFGAGIGAVVGGIAGLFGSDPGQTMKTIGDGIKNAGKSVLKVFVGLGASIVDGVKSLVGFFLKPFKMIMEPLKKAKDFVMDKVLPIMGMILNPIGTLIGSIFKKKEDKNFIEKGIGDATKSVFSGITSLFKKKDEESEEEKKEIKRIENSGDKSFQKMTLKDFGSVMLSQLKLQSQLDYQNNEKFYKETTIGKTISKFMGVDLGAKLEEGWASLKEGFSSAVSGLGKIFGVNTGQSGLTSDSKGMISGVTGFSNIGSLSAKYEVSSSNGSPGKISNTPGDFGGKSYGTYQYTIKGSLGGFVNSLRDTHPQYYAQLTSAGAFGSTSFDNAWKAIAKSDPLGFQNAQFAYTKSKFYDKAADNIKNNLGIDLSTRSAALQSAIFSTAVQHGVGGTNTVLKNAGINAAMTDEAIINAIYDERGKNNGATYFKSSSKAVQQSVANRFQREKADALSMLTANSTTSDATGSSIRLDGSSTSDPVNNGIVHWLQTDPRWGGNRYSVRGNATVASAGCGPTSLAMVAKSFGYNYDPGTLAQWSMANGHVAPSGGSSWSLFPDFGRHVGLEVANMGRSSSSVMSSLMQGKPVIASMAPGEFTKGGHFIVLRGLDSNGKILVNDSASKARTGKAYDPNLIFSQAKNFWAFSKNGKGLSGNINTTANTKILNGTLDGVSATGSSVDFDVNYTTPKTTSSVTNSAVKNSNVINLSDRINGVDYVDYSDYYGTPSTGDSTPVASINTSNSVSQTARDTSIISALSSTLKDSFSKMIMLLEDIAISNRNIEAKETSVNVVLPEESKKVADSAKEKEEREKLENAVDNIFTPVKNNIDKMNNSDKAKVNSVINRRIRDIARGA